MQLATVVGQVVSTVKEPGLARFKLLILRDTEPARSGRTGQDRAPAYVAVDLVGAGEGEVVLVARGSAARVATASHDAPADCAVIAIADSVIWEGTVTYRKG
jgi:ethanolamine utilization protein EutN